IRSALRTGELDGDVAGLQSASPALYERARIIGDNRSDPCAPELLLTRSLLHLFAQTQWPHIGPHLLDVGQALCLWPTLAHVAPAQRVLPVRWPDGILLLVVHHHLVDRCIF